MTRIKDKKEKKTKRGEKKSISPDFCLSIRCDVIRPTDNPFSKTPNAIHPPQCIIIEVYLTEKK